MRRDRNEIVFLAGFSGSGKSTVGKIVAKKLKRRFFDLDRQIELRAGVSVAELFVVRGERAFRTLESQRLRLLCRTVKGAAVVALGGGTLMHPINQNLVKSRGISIYLRCSQAELRMRLRRTQKRPLFSVNGGVITKAKVKKLFDQRVPGYGKCDYQISVTKRSAVVVARKVCEIIASFK